MGSPFPSRVFHSAAADREVPYSFHLPAGDAPAHGWPLVLLVHGMGRNHRTIADDAEAAALAQTCPFAIVFSDGHDYPGPQHAGFKFVLRELLDVARRELPVSPASRQTGICGWSMGGYTALRFAEAFPEEVHAVATGIGVLDPPEPDAAPRDAFRADDPLAGAFSPLPHAERLRGHAILIVGGQDDSYRGENQRMVARLETLGIPHRFVELPGGHTFATVRSCLPHWFGFMAETLGGHSASPS